MGAMPQRTLSRVAFAALGAAWLLLPGGPAAAGEKPVEPPLPTVVPANDEERKLAQTTLAQAETDKSTELLVRALTQMQARKCDDFVPVIRKFLDHDDMNVQAAAISAAASNEMKDEEKRVRKIFRSKPKQKSGTGRIPGVVATACIDYLTRLQIAGEEEYVLSEWLKETIGDERRMKQDWAVDVIRNGLSYLARMKHKAMVPWLIDEMLPMPVPANPNDPKNPPATYWEARAKLWQSYEGWTRWALKELTGQEYRSQREWQAWLKQQDKKAFK